jgi:ABC-type branched-subunit amino acid transport system ATPase component
VKFQNISAFGELTTLQNLFVPLRRNHPKAEILERAATVLARVGLAGTENLPVRQLSQGQQQSLSIGLSIAAEPDLLLLDEPTAGLSVDETARTADLIRNLNASGMTVIVIEHDMAGEIVAVIGRNGVGKTTLMKTIIGELPSMAGAIRFSGIDLAGLNSTQRSRLVVGYVPQGREVFARMSVAENLAAWASMRRTKRI